MGIEPTPSAWKAEVLPLNYTRLTCPPQHLILQSAPGDHLFLVEGGGFEPPKAEPSDLQSDPFDHSGTPPKMQARYCVAAAVRCQQQIMDLRRYLPAEKHQASQGCRPAGNSYN